VDVDTAHIIVHFLHIGAYQTLADEDDLTGLTVSKEFGKSVLVLTAAKKYGLSELSQLARAELENRSAHMDIAETVQVVNEGLFTLLQHDNT
jgi:hypothetical protein